MRIGAIQKTTLLDYPGKVACTVFLSGCNLRCPFCHNAGLVLPDRQGASGMTREALFSFLSGRRGKLDGVCITGGEPTIYSDLPDFMREIRRAGFLVKLDTNGSNPRMLRQILEDDLADYVAMDIKNSPARYTETCGGICILPEARESAALLMEGHTDYEFRTTVCSPYHRPEDLEEIGKWLKGAKRYFLQPFEDSGDLVGQGSSALTEKEMQALFLAVREYIPSTQIRGI